MLAESQEADQSHLLLLSNLPDFSHVLDFPRRNFPGSRSFPTTNGGSDTQLGAKGGYNLPTSPRTDDPIGDIWGDFSLFPAKRWEAFSAPLKG